MLESLPASPLLLGAILVAFTRGPLRALVMLAAPLLGAWGVYQLEPGTVVEFQKRHAVKRIHAGKRLLKLLIVTHV